MPPDAGGQARVARERIALARPLADRLEQARQDSLGGCVQVAQHPLFKVGQCGPGPHAVGRALYNFTVLCRGARQWRGGCRSNLDEENSPRALLAAAIYT